MKRACYKKRVFTEKEKKEISERIKNNWKDPEIRAKNIKGLKEGQKRLAEDPNMRLVLVKRGVNVVNNNPSKNKGNSEWGKKLAKIRIEKMKKRPVEKRINDFSGVVIESEL